MSNTYADRPDASEYAPYYGRYIDLVPTGNIVETLARQIDGTTPFLKGLTEAQAESRYEPGKWSIKEVVGHIIDGERVFAYRAMRFGRNDPTPLASFEQDDYVKGGGFSSRTIQDLATEFDLVRRANLHMLGGLPAEAWARRGVASENEVSVLALAYIIAGHELHHLSVIRARYL